MSDEIPVPGSEPAHGNRVLATVLFTDIVGATEKVATIGDQRWRDVLRRHNSMVRRDLGRFRGREVDTAGDGFFAVFDEPAWDYPEEIYPVNYFVIELRPGVVPDAVVALDERFEEIERLSLAGCRPPCTSAAVFTGES